jgi:choline monooxygenase
MMRPIDWSGFSSDPAQSGTIPPHLYHDPSVFAAEQARIFAKEWHFLGHVNEAAQPGDYFTARIAGQNILVARGQDGVLRAFHNVCQHRAHELLEGRGNAPLIVCPYHAWSYRCDGSLKAVSGKAAAANIDVGKIRLTEIRTDVLAGFLFGTLDLDATPLTELAPGLEKEILDHVPMARDLVLLAESGGAVEANWKVMLENSLECYHCETRHKSFCRSVSMADYRVSTDGMVRRHLGPMEEIDSSGARIEGNYIYWHIWPLTEFSVRTHSPVFSVYINQPLTADRTHVLLKAYGVKDLSAAERDRIINDYVLNNVTDQEDTDIVESVQRGLKSVGFAGGRFAAASLETHAAEHCVHQFQSLVRQALA